MSWEERDEANLKDPARLAATLLESTEPREETLAYSEFLDEDDEFYESDLDEAYDDAIGLWDEVADRLEKRFSEPVFRGTDDLPWWAGLGHAVVYWLINSRLLYLQVTQVDAEMPFFVHLGVTSSPPPDGWFAGA